MAADGLSVSSIMTQPNNFLASSGSPSRLSFLISDQTSSKALSSALLDFSPATLVIFKIIADNTDQKKWTRLTNTL